MGALRSPLSTETLRKPAKQALNKYGRDPKSGPEKLRAQSDYDSEKGYAPLYHSMLADWPRISRGHTADILMMIVLSKSLGRSVKKGEARQQATPALKLTELAELCRCDLRSIQRELKDFQTRGIASVEDAKRGEVIITLLYRSWEALPDYAPPPPVRVASFLANLDISTGEEVEEAENSEEQAKDSAPTHITRKPVRVKAGGSSKALKVECGVKTLRYEISGPVDVEFEAVVKQGELLVTSRVSEEAIREAKIGNARYNEINDLNSPARHGCREQESKSGRREQNSHRRTESEIHPRAVELCEVFDPLLAKWQSRLLCMDPVALKAACEAIADTDPNFLIEFLNKGSSPRASREIKSPKHVAAICQEARKTWKKHGTLPKAAAESKEAETNRRFLEMMQKGPKDYGR